MKRIVELFILTILLIACKSESFKEKDASKINVEMEDKEVKVIYKSTLSDVEIKSNIIINKHEDYIKFLENNNLNIVENKNLLNVDFTKKQILVYYLGQRNTGGYEVELSESVFKTDGIYVKFKEIQPKLNENVTMVITSPWIMVEFPKNKNIIVLN